MNSFFKKYLTNSTILTFKLLNKYKIMNCWNKINFRRKSHAASVSNSRHLMGLVCLNRNCTNI